MYPKMTSVFQSSLSCAHSMKYADFELFPELQATNKYIENLCENYFLKYEGALLWNGTSTSICDTWNKITCDVVIKKNLK